MQSRVSLVCPQALVTYLITIMLAGMYALIAPTLSLFLVQEMDVQPFWVGAFFVLVAIASIVYGHLVALWSDKLARRHELILIGMILGALSCFVFAHSRSYVLILVVGVTTFGLSSAVIPQIFALTREFADQRLAAEQTTLFNSIVRACIAVAWVAAPPLGFFMLSAMGAEKQYALVGALYLLGGFAAYLFLPNVSKNQQPAPSLAIPENNYALYLAVVAFALMFAANQSYILGLPLMISQSLGADAGMAGWLMGTAAALEIPVMITAGWLASRFQLLNIVRTGCVAAIALYFFVWQADSLAQLFALQLLNAIFIGSMAGLGITLFQDLLPGKAGVGSAWFANTQQLGNVFGSAMIALFAGALGYQNLFAVNMIAASLALVALLLLNHKQRTAVVADERPFDMRGQQDQNAKTHVLSPE